MQTSENDFDKLVSTDIAAGINGHVNDENNNNKIC